MAEQRRGVLGNASKLTNNSIGSELESSASESELEGNASESESEGNALLPDQKGQTSVVRSRLERTFLRNGASGVGNIPKRRKSSPPHYASSNGMSFIATTKELQSLHKNRAKHGKTSGGGNSPLEEFEAPDIITQEDIDDINKLIAPYKDVSTVEELIDLAEERLKEHAPGLRRRKGKSGTKLLQLEIAKHENAKHNLAVLKQKPTKLHHEGGYRKKTMYKRTKFIRKTRRKLRNN